MTATKSSTRKTETPESEHPAKEHVVHTDGDKQNPPIDDRSVRREDLTTVEDKVRGTKFEKPEPFDENGVLSDKAEWLADKIGDATERANKGETVSAPNVAQPKQAGAADPNGEGVVMGPQGPEIAPWLDCLQRAEKAYNDGRTEEGDELIALMFRYRGIRVMEQG